MKKFPQKSKAKISAGAFDVSQIRNLIKDKRVESALNPVELSVWMSLKSVMANFLGNKKSSQYQKAVDTLLENSTNLEHAFLLRCISFIPISIIFLRTVVAAVKNKENVLTWNATMVDGVSIFWPTTAGA